MDDDGTGPARFVADRRPELLRTALLLTGDRARAEELVQRALSRAGRGSDPDAVLRALVRGATSRWSQLAHAEQVIEAGTVPADDAGPDLPRALRDLPARTRAVVVLRWYSGLPDPRIAELLRCPVATVADQAALGLDRLRPAVAPSVYERVADESPAEQRLADQLARLATAAGSWRLGSAEAVDDVRARRSQGRRRLAAGAVAALAVVAVAVPLARWAPESAAPAPSARAGETAADATPPPIAPRSTPVLTGPTRGSLAADAAFVDAVRRLDWNGLEAPPPAEREVVLAADTPHGRVALVVGTLHEDFRGLWLTGPPGAAATDLEPHLPVHLGRDRPLSVLLGGPGDATLVVVAAAGDEIAVSDRLMTGPRGTVGRRYDPVPDEDGVAVAPARTTALGPALSVRVTREGRPVHRAAVDWLDDDRSAARQLPALSALRPGTSAPDQTVVAAALADLAVPLGTEPAALKPELLWADALPLGRGTGSVAVVVAHSPGGALVVTTWAGSRGGSVSCGTQTPPGSAELGTLIVARICDLDLPGRADGGQWLVFTGAPEAVSAQLLDYRGTVLGPLELTGGSAVVPLPLGARSVRTLDADGQPVRDTPIAPPPTEPFGDFGRGPNR